MNTWNKAIDCIQSLLGAGVREFVVCGGARNAVFLEILAQLSAKSQVKVWSHFEERSAGFFALGRTMEDGQPCAVVVTSGTAVAELLPATIEAYYQARPLVLVTADRPEYFSGSGAPQAIEQVNIFGEYAHQSLSSWSGLLPLHLNVALNEEFTPKAIDTSDWQFLDFVKREERPSIAKFAQWLRKPSMRGLVIALGALDEKDQEEVFHFCNQLAVPVIVDAASGLREALQHLAWIGADSEFKERAPSKLLRIGGVPSGRFWRDLEGISETEVWSITPNGLRGLARDAEVTVGSPGRILAAMGEVEPQGDIQELLDGVEATGAEIEENLETFPDSEPGWFRTLSIYAALGESVYLGNSLPIREWNSYAQWEHPIRRVLVNRGANGIDGQISSWLGATANQENAWAFLGDLTTLYDFAGLTMLPQVQCKGRVLVVVNNSGGQIFSKIPRFQPMLPKAKDWMTADRNVSFEKIAQVFDIDYFRLNCIDDFESSSDSDNMVLLEVFPDSEQSRQFL